jgi:hypothetical protein
MAYGTVNADVIQSSVSGVSLGAGNASIMKNRIINGSMVINQRGASATSTGYTVDRWAYNATQASKGTAAQSSTAPAGFNNSLSFTSSSAYSVGAGDYFGIVQPIEGYNVADLGWGTANAKTITLSFWVQSSLTGTFSVSIYNGAANRCYVSTYTIYAANTWEQKTVTVAGDTTGTWAKDNTSGMIVWFGLGTGTTYSGAAGSWGSSLYLGATGATSVVGTNGATFYITGVQLEVGSSATGFEYRQYQQELALCQRYYQAMSPISVFSYFSGASQSLIQNFNFPVTMRAAPTVTITSNGTTSNFSSIGNLGTTVNGASIQVVGAGAGQGGCYNAVGNAAIEL